MKKLILVICIFLFTTVTYAQDTSLFTVFGDEAVVSREQIRYTDPGAALFYEGQFHMFYNVFNSWPGHVEIKYATSEDGLTWEKQGDEPVLTDAEIPYAGYTALAASVLVEPDGTWVLYFYTWESTGNFSPSSVGRATALAPTGPWTPDPAPVLTFGSAGEWDEVQVTAPSVVKTEEGYVMYYTGANRTARMIGMATSVDGITWEKYDDPETTAAPYAESDPIITEPAWQPQVQITPQGWVMQLTTGTQFPDVYQIYATSTDGLTWSLATDQRIVQPQDVPRGRAIWFTELVYHEGIYYFYFELGIGSNTEVYVATYAGDLP